MKKIILIVMALSILLVACAEATPTPNIEQTAAVLGAEIAATLIAENEAKEPTETPVPTETPLPTNTIPPFIAESATPDPAISSGSCLAAQLTDENYPDGTVITPGETFTKTWVLRNVGTCAWTDEFSFVYHHGNLQGTQDQFSVGYVAPGQATTFNVTYQAPFSSGGVSEYSSFYSLQAADGTLFGASGFQYFWMLVTVPGNTPTSNLRQAAGFGYSVRSNGSTTNEMIAGDTGNNFVSEAYISWSMGNTPLDAVVTSVSLDLKSSSVPSGDPFGKLGCLVLTELNTGQEVWRFCSVAELTNSIYGGPTARNLVSNAIASSADLTLIATFEGGSTSDGQADNYKFTQPVLSISWYKP
jgi:hypothetical protein